MLYYYRRNDNDDLHQNAGDVDDPSYLYVWDIKRFSFVNYVVNSESHIHEDKGFELVASIRDRLPVEKLLDHPMVFTDPLTTCEWIRKKANRVPVMYNGTPINETKNPSLYVHPNGVILSLSPLTFPSDMHEDYRFLPKQDGFVLDVLSDVINIQTPRYTCMGELDGILVITRVLNYIG